MNAKYDVVRLSRGLNTREIMVECQKRLEPDVYGNPQPYTLVIHKALERYLRELESKDVAGVL